jgi:hypothetical protein
MFILTLTGMRNGTNEILASCEVRNQREAKRILKPLAKQEFELFGNSARVAYLYFNHKFVAEFRPIGKTWKRISLLHDNQ